MLFSADKEQNYILLWRGIVDDIQFTHVPYGNYDVEKITVITEEDILQLHFEYPDINKEERDMVEKESVGYPYPTDWIEALFVKYRNWEYIKELLNTRTKEEVYEEIKINSYGINTENEKVLDVVDDALHEYGTDLISVDLSEEDEIQMLDVNICANNWSKTYMSSVARYEKCDIKELEEELDKRHVSYCW